MSRKTPAAGHQPHAIWPAAREARPGEFAELPERERPLANIRHAHAELDGRSPREALDVLSVRADIEQLAGGRPVACHA